MEDPRTYYWNLLLVHPLERALQFLSTDLSLGAGLAIILFTVLMRVVLLPLTLQQFRSQRAMQRLQPELKELQKKHGKDREKLQLETMALYKQHGVNPAAGCLPLIVQMPILFALYAALSNLAVTDEVYKQPWLWVARLDQPDVLSLSGIPLPFILPVLTAASQWVQQRMMTPPTDDPQQRMQNQVMQFLPLMMLYFGTTISAGVVLYWLTQNVAGIVQQYFQAGWGSLLPTRETPPSLAGGRASAEGSSPRLAAGTTGTTSASDGTPPAAGPRAASRAGQRNGRRNGGVKGGSGGTDGSGPPRRGERRASGKR
ncbi:MAG: YidC/Oxa1 family membrane protein insertase [Chloroflexota bacterium]|nr:YidC/Oxa1 family membrane protein insertase [Chloroflexota bacterium]